jgi:hypothetical protein
MREKEMAASSLPVQKCPWHRKYMTNALIIEVFG